LKKSVLIIFAILSFGFINGQNNQIKHLKAIKNGKPPKINGKLNEKTWDKASTASNFYQIRPYNDKEPSFETEVKIIYDDQAIYVGAIMYDDNPSEIYTELGNRDFRGYAGGHGLSTLNADLFSFLISPFNDGVNMIEFTVSASGVQSDIKHIGRQTDANWDAVWCSAVKITDFGWVAEIKIPYSSLRFPNNIKKDWGLHLLRHIRRKQEWDSWNYIDRKQSGLVNQAGELSGIHDIDPPLRLSFTPYLSGYMENAPGEKQWNNNIRGGLDLKYGFNESFTLDMTLIPDFGQVESEDRILNLSPFEVAYSEKRPFFTEGTELFNKGDLFYSRRIGGEPAYYDKPYEELSASEKVLENPTETRMLNATKVSGRTDNGLGIGILNAVTSESNAIIEDTITGERRELTTQPFTNYNLVVFDQSLKNNSYVSFINTNVHYFNGNFTANVTGTEFSLNNKENSYQVSGKGAVSQKYTESADLGHTYEVEFSKTKGNFRFELQHNVESDTYDPNDFGYLRNNNEFAQQVEFSYNIYDPFSIFLGWYNNIDFEYSQLYKPRKYQKLEVRFFSVTTFQNQWETGVFLNWQPTAHDYFEPRVDGWMFKRPEHYFANFWIETNKSKDISLSTRFSFFKAVKYNQHGHNFRVNPNIRLSDRFSMNYQFNWDKDFNSLGYVEDGTDVNDDVFINFGKRDVKTVTNTFESSFKFNNRSLLNLRVRHYWRTINYSDFYPLKESGDLGESLGYNTYGDSQDLSYNAFSVYLQYLWHFSPGSELSVVWKNNIYTDSNEIPKNYFRNFDKTINQPQINSFSVKLIYYLDYQQIKQGFGIYKN